MKSRTRVNSTSISVVKEWFCSGLEHLQHAATDGSPRIHRHLVTFVEEEDRVLGPAFFIIWILRGRPDVGAAMPAISASSAPPDMRTNLGS